MIGTRVFRSFAKAPALDYSDHVATAGPRDTEAPGAPLDFIRDRFGLLDKFVAAAAATICVSMAVLTYWVSERLESSMVQAAAQEGALLVETFLEPEVQELATSTRLSPTTTERLDHMLAEKLGERVKVVKIWLRDGTLVYATNKKMIGEKFPSAHLDAAFSGRISGSFDRLDDPENEFDRNLAIPLIEIYTPFRRVGGAEVIAVGEIYNDGARLAAELKQIRWATAGIVVCVTAPMVLLLFFMVWRAVAVVRRQRAFLWKRMDEARKLALQNDQLRLEADGARLEAIQSNERLLSQFGQDLHDGPIQLLGVLMLKLTESSQAAPHSGTEQAQLATGPADLVAVALADLRNIARGLALPELEGLTAGETLRMAVRQHEDMTGATVASEIDELALLPEPSLRICLFRIVQEGLNNAYYYARGRGQHVAARESGGVLTITVSDSGGCFDVARPALPRKTQMGLAGLRRRVEAFHGSIILAPHASGMRMIAMMPMPTPATDGGRPHAGGRRPSDAD